MDELTSDQQRIEKALIVLLQYGMIEGYHHKMWTIDQAVRALAGEGYGMLIAAYETEGYEWDTGISP